ncbi:MAG: hypothetical protein JWP38_1417 [Herbaspirillum sp.]|jgi:hypothetical protein|nr:hypothetical protein [Herbaspirillum sp.]
MRPQTRLAHGIGGEHIDDEKAIQSRGGALDPSGGPGKETNAGNAGRATGGTIHAGSGMPANMNATVGNSGNEISRLNGQSADCCMCPGSGEDRGDCGARAPCRSMATVFRLLPSAVQKAISRRPSRKAPLSGMKPAGTSARNDKTNIIRHRMKYLWP